MKQRVSDNNEGEENLRQKFFRALGIIGLVMMAFGSTTHAQTTAVGPYYANPSWDQTLPSNTRFIVLSNMSTNAVLDRETGLVWEKSPSASGIFFVDALRVCANAVTGGRTGWRLPSFHELMSLGDPAASSGLPPGHPFIGNTTAAFWSATTAVGSNNAWVVEFGSSVGGRVRTVRNPTDFGTFGAWCVRGGGPLNAY